ncbi:hypothetical protein RJ639_005390 [Escallonia herrerae]|uniref:Protein kinase domain-containing protein n=1 Tax=Escallonia herrerae TaxID=1293975 RepID=A0AA89AV53_9ASTE|nr:hypothetical protein RJ639_005390 [Escallonia herrerae]
MAVAVKMLNLRSKVAINSFIAECKALRNIRYRNLVKIITACSSISRANTGTINKSNSVGFSLSYP